MHVHRCQTTVLTKILSPHILLSFRQAIHVVIHKRTCIHKTCPLLGRVIRPTMSACPAGGFLEFSAEVQDVSTGALHPAQVTFSVSCPHSQPRTRSHLVAFSVVTFSVVTFGVSNTHGQPLLL